MTPTKREWPTSRAHLAWRLKNDLTSPLLEFEQFISGTTVTTFLGGEDNNVFIEKLLQ